MLTSKQVGELFPTNLTFSTPEGFIASAAWDATSDMERTRDSLVEKMEWLARQLGRAVEQLNAGLQVNSVGVCQGQAADIDRLCGELTVQAAHAARLQRAARQVGLLPKEE